MDPHEAFSPRIALAVEPHLELDRQGLVTIAHQRIIVSVEPLAAVPPGDEGRLGLGHVTEAVLLDAVVAAGDDAAALGVLLVFEAVAAAIGASNGAVGVVVGEVWRWP